VMSCFDPAVDSSKLFRAGNSEVHPRSLTALSSLQSTTNMRADSAVKSARNRSAQHTVPLPIFSCKLSPRLNLISYSLHQGPVFRALLVIACSRRIRFRNCGEFMRWWSTPIGDLPISDPPHTARTLGLCQMKLYNGAVKGKWVRAVSETRAAPTKEDCREEAIRQSSRRARSKPGTILAQVLDLATCSHDS
jgi:hypothetical protein